MLTIGFLQLKNSLTWLSSLVDTHYFESIGTRHKQLTVSLTRKAGIVQKKQEKQEDIEMM